VGFVESVAREQARTRGAFLRCLLPDGATEAAGLRLARTDPSGDGQRWEEHAANSIDSAVGWLSAAASRGDTYSALALFAEGEGRSHGAVVAKSCVSVDIDDKALPGLPLPEAHERWRELVAGLPFPFLVVDTGGGFHVHVRVPAAVGLAPGHDAPEDRRRVEVLGRALRLFVESAYEARFGFRPRLDRCHGVERVWRVPPGFNCKAQETAKALTPERTRWRRVCIDAEDECAPRSLPEADLGFLNPHLPDAEREHGSGDSEQEETPRAAGVLEPGTPSGDIPEALRASWPLPQGDQSENDFAVACAVLEAGRSRADAELVVRARRAALSDAADREKGSREDYIAATVRRAEERVGAKGGLATSARSRALRFRTVEEMRAEAANGIEWLWDGLLAPGLVTLLIAKPKAGKSTLAFALAAALERGLPFLDRPTREAATLYVSEESSATLAEKAEVFGVRRVRFATREDLALGLAFPEVVRRATDAALQHGARVLIIDTLAAWTAVGPQMERDAGCAMEAMRPLADAAAKGLAVIAIHHARKGESHEGDGARGSSAFTAASDIQIEVRRLDRARPNSRARALVTFSRSPATPSELFCTYEGGGVFRASTAPQDARSSDLEQRVLDALQGVTTSGLTQPDLRARVRCRNQNLTKALRTLVSEGKVTATPTGGDARELRFASSSGVGASSPVPPQGGERGTAAAPAAVGRVPLVGNGTESGTGPAASGAAGT